MSQKAIASAAVAELLAQQRIEYQARLPEQLAQLGALADGLTRGKIQRATLDDVHQRLHKLVGTGGTFGFKTLSSRARLLEQQVKVPLRSHLPCCVIASRAS